MFQWGSPSVQLGPLSLPKCWLQCEVQKCRADACASLVLAELSLGSLLADSIQATDILWKPNKIHEPFLAVLTDLCDF